MADEVWRLKRKKDVEGDFFRRFCDKGHYQGGDDNSNTRQGIYLITPRGDLLGSLNSRDSGPVVDMLQQALISWDSLPSDARKLEQDPQELSNAVIRLESKYPTDGLVLRAYTRDLPRNDAPADWRKDVWNSDFAWFTKPEATALATPGSSRAALLNR
ncbi:MAG: hypothetical protein ABUL72_00275, partial [Armatimonadota bacterium]